jgi:hypothetical protein
MSTKIDSLVGPIQEQITKTNDLGCCVYPDPQDEKIAELIASKMEFRYLDNNLGLFPYQEFVRRYLSPYTPYKYLVLYHSLGSGKTIACLSVAIDHQMYSNKHTIIITKGSSSEDNFRGQIAKYEELTGRKVNHRMFRYYHYVQLSNIIKKRESYSTDKTDSSLIASILSNSIVIMDEVHNLREMESGGTLETICKAIRLSVNSKFLFCTGTPMINSPEEIMSLLHLTGRLDMSCKCVASDRWAHLLRGIISHSRVSTNKPSENLVTNCKIGNDKYYRSIMKSTQLNTYINANKVQDHKNDMYGDLIHVSLLCMPGGVFGSNLNKEFMKQEMITKKHICNSESIETVRYVKYSFKQEYTPFIIDQLDEYSGVYSTIINIITRTENKKIFIFLEYVMGSGIVALASVIENHGFELYAGGDIKFIDKKRRFTFCVGNADICPNLSDRINNYNDTINSKGEYIQVLIGSKVIGESISLLDVRQFHFVSHHWNKSTLEQAKGRVIREGSHQNTNAQVDVYVHVASLPSNVTSDKSIDEYKISISDAKQRNISCMESILQSCAVDRLVYNHVDYNTVPDTRSFTVLYACDYIQDYIGTIQDIITRRRTTSGMTYMNITKVTEDMKAPYREFAFQIIRMVIIKNIKINNMYLRCFFDNLFLTDDITIPFYGCRPLESKSIRVKDALEDFRWIPQKEKIEVLEQAFVEGNKTFLRQVSTLFIQIDRKIYHFMYYKMSKSSYTACVPVPSKPYGKTRVFNGTVQATNTGWKFCKQDEQKILGLSRDAYHEFLQSNDRKYAIYGYISIIDGNIRIRVRPDCQNSDYSSISLQPDKRKINRGRFLMSYTKQELLQIMDLLDIEHDKTVDKSRASAIIEDYLITNDMYCFI